MSSIRNIYRRNSVIVSSNPTRQIPYSYFSESFSGPSAWGITQPIWSIFLNVLRNLKHSLDILHECFNITVVVTQCPPLQIPPLRFSKTLSFPPFYPPSTFENFLCLTLRTHLFTDPPLKFRKVLFLLLKLSNFCCQDLNVVTQL